MYHGSRLAVLAVVLGVTSTVAAAEPTAAQRGEKALLGRHFTAPAINLKAYRNVWKFWEGDLKEAPADFDRLFRERYGMHEAPYPNKGYPMGLREASTLLGGKALSVDCMICHGGSIFGKSYVGLGNTALDYQALTEEIAKASNLDPTTPFPFSHVRGTVEAGAMSVFLLSLREPDLRLRTDGPLDLDLKADMYEDTPAWWLLKKKKTMYHDGGSDARSVRSLMQFMMSPLNLVSSIKSEEATFRDIQAYLLSLEAPKYPLPIDRDLAKKGEFVFRANCMRCHGTYGAKASYPNKIVPLKEIGTDPARVEGLSDRFGDYYNRSWFAKENEGWMADDYRGARKGGYQAPPLDGVWATAPYFHNGSSPTVYHVLNTKARPTIFTRSYGTGKDDYDPVKLGWKVTELKAAPGAKTPAIERRKVYDTRQRGAGNRGHTFGDDLTDEERMAVIEYLKTL
jgi:hypothetical protein